MFQPIKIGGHDHLVVKFFLVQINLPPPDLARLGIDPGDYAILRQRDTHTVYRVRAGDQHRILKVFASGAAAGAPAPAREVRVYVLLRELGIPTLPVHALGDNFLLIEDLLDSPIWRLASEEDMGSPVVGVAVADWYRRLHRTGAAILHPGGSADFLTGWIETVNDASLAAAGQKLALDGLPIWQAIRCQVEPLKAAYRALPQTLNYQDFAAENLALSRAAGPLRAVVFDYDCFTTGTAYSDCRNVIGSLQGSAQEAFQAAYGPLDPAEALLDTALCTLEGLVMAASQEHFPFWAQPLLDSLCDGTFAADLDRAVRVWIK